MNNNHQTLLCHSIANKKITNYTVKCQNTWKTNGSYFIWWPNNRNAIVEMSSEYKQNDSVTGLTEAEPVIASHSSCRFVSFTCVMWISCSTTSQWCYIGYVMFTKPVWDIVSFVAWHDIHAIQLFIALTSALCHLS